MISARMLPVLNLENLTSKTQRRTPRFEATALSEQKNNVINKTTHQLVDENEREMNDLAIISI